MKKLHASKSAGFHLLLIILALAVPMTLFASNYIRNAREDIQTLETERLGTALTQRALAKHLSNLKQLSNSEQALISEIEDKIGISTDARFAQNRFEKYIADVASASGLILDSNASSFHLAAALTVSLPELISDADEMIVQLNSNAGATSSRMQTAILLGRMEATMKRLFDSIQRSKVAHKQTESFHAIELAAASLNAAIVRSANQNTAGVQSSDSVILRQQNRALRTSAQLFQEPAYHLLNGMLDERRETQSWKLLMMTLSGLCSAILALGMAAAMFSRTFKRLDELEAAKKSSEDLRVDAEQTHAEVANLNLCLSQRLTELKAAQSELLHKGKMEQLGQLTATVAHEIRNPLGAVRTSAYIIGRKAQGKNLDVEQQLVRINTGVARCDRIITQLLDFSRTTSVQTQSTNLDDWLEKVMLEDCAILPPNVEIECRLGLEGLEVRFDEARLRRAVVNLITNACEAMVGKDFVPAKELIANPKLTVSTHVLGGEVCIDVEDNGPGMPAHVLSRIREPLYSTKNFGAGLGLPAVEQISMQHGGRLRIQSKVGVGSKFSICLPLEKSEEREAA